MVVVGGGGVDVVVVVVTAPPPLEAGLDLWAVCFLVVVVFFVVLCVVCVEVVEVVVVFFLLATGVVDPPDPHPAISAAMAMAEIRIRFMGPPLVSSFDGLAGQGNNIFGGPDPLTGGAAGRCAT